jgi:hypothetical protein
MNRPFLLTLLLAAASLPARAGAPVFTVVSSPAAGASSNGRITAANLGSGKNLAVFFGGYTATEAAAKSWVSALAQAQGSVSLTSLGIGRVYAVPGPRASTYPAGQREVPTSAMVDDLIAHAGDAHLILVAAHSSGAFVADSMLSQLAARKPALLARVALVHLDGGWLLDLLKPSISSKLAAIACVSAQCGTVPSRNTGAMSRCAQVFGPRAPHLTVQAPGTGCKKADCCHDALLTTRPHNPNTFEVVKDSTDFTGGRAVQTGWLVAARALLEPLAR